MHQDRQMSIMLSFRHKFKARNILERNGQPLLFGR
jgi:hypothetical protein